MVRVGEGESRTGGGAVGSRWRRRRGQAGWGLARKQNPGLLGKCRWLGGKSQPPTFLSSVVILHSIPGVPP